MFVSSFITIFVTKFIMTASLSTGIYTYLISGLIRTELICLSELDVGQIYLTEQIPGLIRNLVPDRFQSHSICNEA